MRIQTAMNQSPSASPIAPHQAVAALTQGAWPAVTFPSDTDVLHPGQKYTITWQDAPSNTTSYSVNLEVAASGNYYVMMPLGMVSPQQRSLDFVVPNAIPPRTNYQIAFSKGTQIADIVFRSKGFTIK